MTKILEGKKLSNLLAVKLAKRVKKLRIKPKIIIIQIGNLAESNTYIKNKKLFAERIGVEAIHKRYSPSVREPRIIADIFKYNKDKRIHGIMVQLPAPAGFDIERVLEVIDPKKDVDGLTALNTRHLFDNNPAFVPATAKGVINLLENYRIRLAGKKAVIVGASSLVGRPLTLGLLNKGATVTVCHKNTRNLEKETRQAEILITAVGKPRLITKKHVVKNQVVVDVGITILKNKKIVGDVDFESVRGIVRAITPVPGGVGPMTVASLLENLLEAHKLQTK
jgi:methylenetetrahydrofolate dehydrogenase (NADP+) / methenyltetrahydrofolate cyclohydrolase